MNELQNILSSHSSITSIDHSDLVAINCLADDKFTETMCVLCLEDVQIKSQKVHVVIQSNQVVSLERILMDC